MGKVLRIVLGISEAETTFARRGFRGGENGMRERLERVGQTFVHGYHAVLDHPTESLYIPRLEKIEPALRGFAYEGAAMALGILDRITPWRGDRVKRFLEGAGDPHAYMVHVALGWVAARIPGRLDRQLQSLDPLLRWLVLDGYGFHEGFFNFERYQHGQPHPRRISGYGTRAFDQGLGRSLWFVEAGGIGRLSETIRRFAEPRQPDLWSGIGLASVYAGQVGEEELEALVRAAGVHAPQLAQGAAFAAKARHRAGNPTEYTDRACRILCRQTSANAAAITDAALENLPTNGAEPAYEAWRRRTQQLLSERTTLPR